MNFEVPNALNMHHWKKNYEKVIEVFFETDASMVFLNSLMIKA